MEEIIEEAVVFLSDNLFIGNGKNTVTINGVSFHYDMIHSNQSCAR